MHDVADWQFPPAQVGKGTPVPDPQKTYLELSKKRKKSLKLFPRSEIKDSLERATPFKGKKRRKTRLVETIEHLGKLRITKLKKFAEIFQDVETALNLL